MIMLAIDPGPENSAWVLYDGARVLGHDIEPSEALASRIRRRMWCDMPDHCAIEKIQSYGMAVGAEVFETCVYTGRFIEAAGAAAVTRIPRLEVKLWLCHDSRARDANIRQALIDRFGGPQAIRKSGPLYGIRKDEWAALAVAVTWWDKYRMMESR